MSRKANKRVSFSPDVNERQLTFFLKESSSSSPARSSGRNGNRVVSATWTFRMPRDSRILSVKFLRGLSAKIAKAVRCVSETTKFSPPLSSPSPSFSSSSSSSSSRKVSSAAISNANFVRSRSVSDAVESHRAEAVEDCIEFLNSSSSSSLSRSNSVSGRSCY